MGYRWREDLTRADVAFEATGATPPDVLHSAWTALVEVMLPGGGQGQGENRGRILSGSDWAEVLLALLEWVVYVKDAEGILLTPVALEPLTSGGGIRVSVTAAAIPVAAVSRRLGTDVKAVTLHHYSMVPTPQGWRATVVLDV